MRRQKAYRLIIACCLHGFRCRRAPSIFIAGDSTAAAPGAIGWASVGHCSMPKVNEQRGGAAVGRSSKGFGPPDRRCEDRRHVLIQFGHNDGGRSTADARVWLPGLGDETQEIDNLLTK
jgi:hypothetical protein